MTAIGKIFVIINLLFSLVVAGFIVMIYAKSANWASATTKWETAYKAADASRQAVQTELDQERANHSKDLAAKDVSLKDLQAKVNAAAADQKASMTSSENINKNVNAERASMMAIQTELDKRKKEVVDLENQLKDKDDSIVKHIKAKNDAVDAKVAAEIKATSFQAKAERLEARVRETEMEIVKLRRTGASGSGGSSLVTTASTSNPPSQAVEGIVTEKSGDLIRISIGSDAGLEKGHTLDVFRLKPTPQYLGQIRLTDVRAAEAVGVPVDRMKYPVQKGDFVSNDVTSKK